MLVTFVGCSGVGKNTIIKDLIAAKGEKYDLLPSVTTREPREGETNGNPYYFVSREEFEKKIADGEMYEYEFVHTNYYGGSRKVLNEKKATGKTLITDIDILGTATLKKKLADEIRVMSVFLYVDSAEELFRRLHGRGDEEEDIAVRAKRFEMEMGLSGNSDYMVNNISREDTGKIIDALIQAENAGRTYALACALPTEEEISKAEEAIRGGETPAPAQMVFSGSEILIAEGADRYAAAVRLGAFIQKKFSTLPDETAVPNEKDDQKWRALLSAK